MRIADAILLASKSRSKDVKTIINQLAAQQRENQTLNRKMHRPCVWYDSIFEGSHFKVKRILVVPKASLCLQKDNYRDCGNRH